jgi:enoyl-CoA hydratase/carnithine racemase
MAYKYVILEAQGHVATVILNRPEQMNTFNTKLAKDFTSALDDCEQDRQIRVLILRGAGRAFCAGLDLSEFADKTLVEYREWTKAMDEMYVMITTMRKPVIAAVHGYATAAGAGLVSACDLAIAAEGSRFGQTAINIGLFCIEPAVPLLRALGKKRALGLLFTGDLIDAHEAERIGLINKVVAADNLEKEAMELAEKLAKKSPVALQMGKRAFYTMSDMEYVKAIDYAGQAFAALCATEDAKEGVRAFQNKVEPRWKER